MFSRVSMMQISGGEISNKSKCAKKVQFQNVGKHCKSDIRSVQKSETIIWTMFIIVSMVRIAGIEISRNPKCAKKKLQLRNLGKHCKSDIHLVPNVGKDDLNYVCHISHDAHHRSRNFEKVKMCNTNCNLEKFENTVNLIYPVCYVFQS